MDLAANVKRAKPGAALTRTSCSILNHVQTHGSITRREVVELWDLSENQAAYLLRKLAEQGKLQMVGRGRGTHCKLGNSGNLAPHSDV
jgi:predicted transcriptional regulator of viral defense system